MCHHWTYDHEDERENEHAEEHVEVPLEEETEAPEREDDPLADVPAADD